MTGENNKPSGRRRFLSAVAGGALLAAGAGAKAMLVRRRKATVSHEEVAAFTRQFAVLLDRGGLSLVEILDTLIEKQENPAFRAILRQINAEVAEGATLSREMAKYPSVFDAAYIAAIQQGEYEGTLEVTVQQLAQP